MTCLICGQITFLPIMPIKIYFSRLLFLLVVTAAPSYGMLGATSMPPGPTNNARGVRPLEGVLLAEEEPPRRHKHQAYLPLHAAIIAAQMAKVRQLAAQEQCDVNAQDEEGNTPLPLALLRGDARVTTIFSYLWKPEELQRNLYNKQVPYSPRLDVSRLSPPTAFLDRGAQPGVLACMQADDLDGFFTLLDEEDYDHSQADEQGNTPLHWATIWRIGTDYIEALIAYGAVINYFSTIPVKPLWISCLSSTP